MANKDNVTRIQLDGLLNLNKYRNEIKQFEGFNKKNSPIYSNILSPLNKGSFTNDSNVSYAFVNNDIYTMRVNPQDSTKCIFEKNGEIIPNVNINKNNITKKLLNIPYEICAFDINEENNNIIDLFVKKGDYFSFMSYDTTTDTLENVVDTNLESNIITSKIEMRNGLVFFYQHNPLLSNCLWFIDKYGHMVYNDWTTISEYQITDAFVGTINKLPSSFNVSPYTDSYLITFTAQNRFEGVVGYGKRIVRYNQNGIDVENIDIESISDSTLDAKQIPMFAPMVSNPDEIEFYNTFVRYFDSTNKTYYMTGTINSYNHQTHKLYLNCEMSITTDNTNDDTWNYHSSMQINPYFYSAVIFTNRTSTYNDVNCKNHHVLFDSAHKEFIGNCGFIPYGDSSKTVYLPYGFRCTSNPDDKFSLLINYGEISNICTNAYPLDVFVEDEDLSLRSATLAEWNFIDDKVSPKFRGTKCVYKISNENTLAFIKIEQEVPEMKVLFDKYIVIQNNEGLLFDINYSTFYNGFVSYNNSNIPYEDDCAHSLQHFPYRNSDNQFRRLTMSSELKDYLYASAVNPNMEISKINISSIQYNPQIINQGSHIYFASDNRWGRLSSYSPYTNFVGDVNIYISDYNLDTVPLYYATLANNTFIYRDESLRNIPYPIASNGNILYTANLLSQFINSYTNRDMIINDTVSYPLVYINNQPTLSFYFLNGIEGAYNSFMINGLNYVVTKDFIFSANFNGDTISNTEAIVSVKGFTFLGNNTECAYFFSRLKKSLYAFFGDRSLVKLYDCTEISSIKNAYFNPINYNIYVTTDDAIYVIDENTNYKIDIANVNNMYFSDTYIFVDTDELIYLLSYEKTESTNEKIPIKLETQLYGLGNNTKSVIDCIYLRLFNNDINEKGSLKLKVKTLTDKGETTEEKTFYINSSDWDKESNTFYIRYQPKNQECIGMSVDLVSDFAIADFNIGYSSDGTIQVSKHNV